MAAPAIQKGIGGVTPGGVITITPGVPIPVTVNLNLVANRGKLMCRQIGISVDNSVSGQVYLNYGNFAGEGIQTGLIVQSSSVAALPVNSRTTEGQIDATQWYLDGSAACKVAINFVDANSW
jgi:hypothetical protein